MDFIDLKTQYRRLKPSIDARLARVFEHGQFIMGPEVAELEAVLAKYAGTRYCIAASSGTDTLMIAMMALGIGAGAELQRPLALAVIGGLSLSTLITVYLIPSLYAGLYRKAAPTRH